MYCNKCGKQITDNSVYCNFCGGKIEIIDNKESNKKVSAKSLFDDKKKGTESSLDYLLILHWQ